MFSKQRALGLIVLCLLLTLSFAHYSNAVGGCIVNTPTEGICDWYNITIVTTTYTGSEGYGTITTLPNVNSPNPTTVIKGILLNNTKDGQWLLTCPVPPDPTNTTEYILTKPGAMIAGNRCLTNIPALVTTVQYDTFLTWTFVTPAWAWVDVPTVTNIAQGTITNLAYSGLAQNVGSSTTVTTVTTVTTTGSSTTVSPEACPNQNYNGNPSAKLTFAQTYGCAQSAGFSGTQLIIIVSIAYAESNFKPGATGAGIQGGCTAQGILQEGKCGNAGEAYPLSDYSPSSCSTYSGSSDWTGIYYNPTCAFQWAYAFVTINPPITQRGCTQQIGDTPFCFWGTYWVGGSYCNFAPNTYSGYDCAQGKNQANFPWGNPGSGNGGGTGGQQGGGTYNPGAGYNLSNGYDSQSYIFQQVPAAVQHGLWSWNAEYANLSKTDLSKLEVDEEFDDLQDEIPGLCYFTYDYSIHSFVAGINNSNISTPQYNDSTNDNYINFSGYWFSPIKTVTSSSCSTKLQAGQECGGWIKVAINGQVDVNGDMYNGTDIYIGNSSTASDPSANYQRTILAAYTDGLVEANVLNFNYTNVTAWPYLLYNLSIPSAYTQVGSTTNSFLNLSYNLFSTHNLMNPGNVLDQFALYQDSGFFANYNGTISMYPYNVTSILNPNPNGFAHVTGNFLSFLTEKQASSGSRAPYILFGQKSTGKPYNLLGNYVYGQIHNPIAIAASPTGYVYVLNYTQDNCWLCISTTTKSYLFVLRFIPQGYANLSNYQSGKQPFQKSLKAWVNEWKQYARNAFLGSSQYVYVSNVYQLTSTSSNWWKGTKDESGSGSHVLTEFVPLSLATDNAGDLFILGAHLSSGFGSSNNNFAIDAILSNGQKIINQSMGKPNDFTPSDEFAASPGGQYVYVSNASAESTGSGGGGYGAVAQASGEATGYGMINVYSTTANFAYIGNIPLSYSNSTFNVDIAAYLTYGGPYNDSQVANAYASYYKSNTKNPADYDQIGNHHPVSIVDSKGIIYVIDNWTFTIDSATSSILMLRAFAENGTEIPIDPQYINTLVPVNSPGSPGTSNQEIFNGITLSFGWKPYGWPLSANISLPSGGTTVSYCVADCTKDQSSNDVNTGYPPIGPRTDDDYGYVGKGANSIAISSDFNGTLYIISHSWSYSTVTPEKSLYAELLILHPNLQNYTKLSFADNSTFNCYINITVTGDTCISDENTANALGGMYPPLVGVPSTFSYVEGLGGPEQYLTLQNAFASLFPTGINSLSYKSAVNKEESGGFSGGTTINYSTYATDNLNGTNNLTGNIPATYLKSNIRGYLLTPWNTTYVLNQTWDVTDIHSPVPYGVAICAGIAVWLFNYGKSDSVNHLFKYSTTQLSNSLINDTIEGGNIYPQYLPQQNPYLQNLSDAALIISPYINYALFTNRLLGEIYINQSVSPATAASQPNSRTGLPVVINATQIFKYKFINATQVSSLGTFPAFQTEEADPASTNTNSSIVTGANCGGSCPTHYYYGNKYFTGTSRINYTVLGVNQFFPLFELFKRTSYLANLVLNLSKNTPLLGYNRLIYTYVDRFNNTIYQPLDVNFANVTQVTLNASVQVNATNTNQSSINVTGNVRYLTLNGSAPVPASSNVYIYYDGNIGFYNATSSPNSNKQQYYNWALQCGYNSNPRKCQLANPLSTLTQNQPNGGQEATTISFHTDKSAAGGCAPQPTSLLFLPKFNCNLFNQFGLNAINTSGTNYGYCIPEFANGTGRFSSQLGLVAIAKTTSGGNFSTNFTACGVGQNRVTAYYYGTPGPEPLIVNQTNLVYSGSANEVKPNANGLIKSPEFNYSYSPSQSTSSFEIGSYALSFGAVSIAELLIIIGIVVAIALKGMNLVNPSKNKSGKEERMSK